MSYRIRFMIIGLALISSLFLPRNIRTRAQEAPFWYAYIINQNDTQSSSTLTMHAVDPIDPTKVRTVLTLPASVLRQALPSPDGQWIVLISASEVSSYWSAVDISVVKVATSEIHSIIDAAQLYDTGLTFPLENIKSAIWSPNSHYFAFNSISPRWPISDSNGNVVGTTINVYSIDTFTLSTLGSPTSQSSLSTVFSWSKDSTRIATATSASDAKRAEVMVNVYDVLTHKQLHSLPVPGATELPLGLCFLMWVPDGSALSFVMDCAQNRSSYKEVYVAELNGRITQLTHYKQELERLPLNNGLSINFPNPIWYDAHTLLITTTMWRGVTQFQETDAFRWPEDTFVVLTRTLVAEWNLNPVSSEVAYFEQEQNPDQPTIMGQTENQYLHIAEFDGQSLKPTIVVKGSGRLSWSPDGRILANNSANDLVIYKLNEQFTNYHTWNVTFIDKTSGRITGYQPPVDQYTGMTQVGWIQMP
jgi:hypothetical protein